MSDTEQFVPWNEGANLLGIKRSAFFYLVNSGQIHIEPGRGQRDGRYSLEDIETIIAKRAQKTRRQGRKPRRKRVPVVYDWLSPRDIPAILQLDLQVYSKYDLAEAGRYEQWSEKNPQLAMCAFDAKSNRREMLAYVAALPLNERGVILPILRGEREETSITMEEMQTYEEPGAYTLLANSAVCLPEQPELLYHVIARMAGAWIDRFPQRYVTRIYAQAWSERGDMLIQHFFMSPRYDLAPNAYMLDLARPGSAKMIRRFQQALAAKASLPDELLQPYMLEEAS